MDVLDRLIEEWRTEQIKNNTPVVNAVDGFYDDLAVEIVSLGHRRLAFQTIYPNNLSLESYARRLDLPCPDGLRKVLSSPETRIWLYCHYWNGTISKSEIGDVVERFLRDNGVLPEYYGILGILLLRLRKRLPDITWP